MLGLLYADFRVAFKHGMRSVRTALQHENTHAESLAAFWTVASDVVRKAFAGVGHVVLSGKYADRDYEFVEVEISKVRGTKQYRRVFFETISSHGQPAESLDEMWWNEFCSSMDEIPEDLFLVVTEQPIAFKVVRPDVSPHSVCYRQFEHSSKRMREYAVFVDVSTLPRKDWPDSIEQAKRLLSELAEHATARRQKRSWPEMLMIKTYHE